MICDSQPAYARASAQPTSITGRRPRPNPMSLTPCRQAPAAAQASHSANVVSYRATANARGMVTVRTGCSSTSPPPDRSPIRKAPAGTTTSSGHRPQSRMTAPGRCGAVASLAAGASFFAASDPAPSASPNVPWIGSSRRAAAMRAAALAPRRLSNTSPGMAALPLHGPYRRHATAPGRRGSTGPAAVPRQWHSGFSMRRDDQAAVGRGRFPGTERRDRSDGPA